MAGDASTKSILFALLANLGIAITKTIAAIKTGSGSMLAESIHSYADCGNQALLFLGLKRAQKKADANHPLGYGKEIFFWSFIVALILFSMGGLFSIYEGMHKLDSTEEITSPMIAVVVLLIGVVLEGASLLGCIKQINTIKGDMPMWEWLRKSRKSELVVIYGEDLAALIGLTFALFAVLTAWYTGNPIYDAIGSIGIGVLLILISIFLGIEIKSLLIGESAGEKIENQIKEILNQRPEVDKVLNLITIQMGPQILVAIKAKMSPTETTDKMISNINLCEDILQEKIPSLKWVFFEPDNRD